MYRVYMSEKESKEKPSGYSIAYTSQHILKNKFEFKKPKDLAIKLSKGHTVLLSDRKSKDVEISGQDIVMLDFDNSKDSIYSIKDLEKDKFMQENACFYYKTFSHDEGVKDRFRVVFFLDKTATSHNEVEFIYRWLFKKYPQADSSTGQATRLFFGGNQGYTEINFKNKLNDTNHMIEIIEKEQMDYLSEIIDDTTPNHVLIKYKQIELLQERFKDTHSHTFDNMHTAINYFRQVDMCELLGLPDGTFFDIFHDEDSPSANIYFDKEHDVYFYKCFSERHSFTGDITKVMAKLLNYVDVYNNVLFLVEMTNSRLDANNHLFKARMNMENFKKDLNTGLMAKNMPELYSYIKRYTVEVSATMDVMYDYMYLDDNGEVKYMNYFSVEKLAKLVSNATRKKVSVGKMFNILNIIVVTEIISKLPDSEIPTKVYKEVIEPQRNSENYTRSSNVYSPHDLSDEYNVYVEKLAKELKDNDVKISSLSYELMYRLFGEDKAKKNFPQAYKPLEEKGLVKMSGKNKNLTKKSVTFEKITTDVILKEIEKNNYVYEQEVVRQVAKRLKFKQDVTKKKLDKVLQEIILNYDLTKSRCNKEIFNNIVKEGKYSNKNIIYRK